MEITQGWFLRAAALAGVAMTAGADVATATERREVTYRGAGYEVAGKGDTGDRQAGRPDAVRPAGDQRLAARELGVGVVPSQPLPLRSARAAGALRPLRDQTRRAGRERRRSGLKRRRFHGVLRRRPGWCGVRGGDVTEHGTDTEMRDADRVFRLRLPYSVLAGNHDINGRTDDQRGDSAYLRTFGPWRAAGSERGPPQVKRSLHLSV